MLDVALAPHVREVEANLQACGVKVKPAGGWGRRDEPESLPSQFLNHRQSKSLKFLVGRLTTSNGASSATRGDAARFVASTPCNTSPPRSRI